MCGLQEEFSKVIPLYEESLALSRQMGNRAGIARALINLGAIERNLEHYDRAKRFYREAAEISRETGHRRHLAIVLGNLGDVACTCLDTRNPSVASYPKHVDIEDWAVTADSPAHDCLSPPESEVKHPERPRAGESRDR
jgi:tetratricopeptide (TPR) repeat protein